MWANMVSRTRAVHFRSKPTLIVSPDWTVSLGVAYISVKHFDRKLILDYVLLEFQLAICYNYSFPNCLRVTPSDLKVPEKVRPGVRLAKLE